jgi:hypothetical protein
MLSHGQNNNRSSSYEDCVHPLPGPEFRTDFGSGSGTLVSGWPSKGGIYILQNCGGVELEFLDLDRFEVTPRSEDQAEENAHCDRMRKLGGTWWRYRDDFIRHAMNSPTRDDLVFFAGWPLQGGVWVLKTTWLDAAKMGAGRIRNAFNMAERCREIERLGGTFYQDPKNCPDLDLA